MTKPLATLLQEAANALQAVHTGEYPDCIDRDDLVARLAQAAQLAAAPQITPDKLAAWRSFIEDCSKSAGGMVNGNRLSHKAASLLEGVAAPQEAPGVPVAPARRDRAQIPRG